MSDPLDFTGERFTPECEREIWYEHFHRYVLASRWCEGKRTLDAACGEGYGSALLAQTATSVEGADISDNAITHARHRYGHLEGVSFNVADCTSLPFDDDEFERVVSFETLEHLAEQEQLLAEFRRVLKPDGFLILSSPDKAIYSDGQDADNEFHVKELYREEFEALVQRHFPASHFLGQKLMFHSVIWSENGAKKVTLDQLDDGTATTPGSFTQLPMYLIALCAAEQSSLPEVDGLLWLFDDRDESVYQHYHDEIRRHIAAGGRIADLEKELEDLREQFDQLTVSRKPWWQRLLDKT